MIKTREEGKEVIQKRLKKNNKKEPCDKDFFNRIKSMEKDDENV